MGWYHTCEYCGVEGKYGPMCSCQEKQSEIILQKMSESVVKGTRTHYDAGWSHIVFKLMKQNGDLWYVSIVTQCSYDSSPQTVTETDQDDFEGTSETYQLESIPETEEDETGAPIEEVSY